MKVLITGGSGLLGKYLLETKPYNIDVVLTWNKILGGVITNPDIWYKLDIRDRASIFDLFEITRPDIVVHCAAIGSVDFAEKEGYQSVFNVNVTGVKNVVDACNGYKSKIIYISSNAVYSGESPPYNEKSPLEPVNSYGVIKRQAEQVIRDIAKKWLIIRPFLLYGWPYVGGRNNWASSIVEKLTDSKGSYKLVNDHIWMPTYVGDMARTIWQLSNEDHEIYNIASPERATLYEFGLKVCDVFNLEKNLIKPIGSDYFPTIAPRPKDTTYDLVKLNEQGIVLSDIKTGLEKMKAERK
jgi:dTDP-4-dehydrorhamnose reductase